MPGRSGCWGPPALPSSVISRHQQLSKQGSASDHAFNISYCLGSMTSHLRSNALCRGIEQSVWLPQACPKSRCMRHQFCFLDLQELRVRRERTLLGLHNLELSQLSLAQAAEQQVLLQQADAAISAELADSLGAHQGHLPQLQAAQEELIRSAAMSSCLGQGPCLPAASGHVLDFQGLAKPDQTQWATKIQPVCALCLAG